MKKIKTVNSKFNRIYIPAIIVVGVFAIILMATMVTSFHREIKGREINKYLDFIKIELQKSFQDLDRTLKRTIKDQRFIQKLKDGDPFEYVVILNRILKEENIDFGYFLKKKDDKWIPWVEGSGLYWFDPAKRSSWDTTRLDNILSTKIDTNGGMISLKKQSYLIDIGRVSLWEEEIGKIIIGRRTNFKNKTNYQNIKITISTSKGPLLTLGNRSLPNNNISSTKIKNITIQASGERTPYYSIIKISLILTFGILAVVIVCLFYIKIQTKKMLSPLNELFKMTEKIEKGDLDVQLTHIPDDEIGRAIKNVNQVSKELKKQIEEINKKELENTKAMLHSLRNQMRPHFLFNVLNSISHMLMTDTNKAKNMLEMLASLYRQILDIYNEQAISLEQEINIVKNYLDIQKIRFNKRLNVEFNIPTEALSIQIPPMILQTLVENAIKHGISKLIDGGSIKILVTPLQNQYKIEIINNALELKSNIGIGIANTKSRLDLLHGTTHSFKLHFNNNEVIASFFIPKEHV